MPPPHAAASFPAPKSPMSQRRDDNMQRTLGLRAALALSLSYPSVPRFAREHRGAQAMATRRGPGLHSVRCRRLRAPAARRPKWPWSPSEGPARGRHSPYRLPCVAVSHAPAGPFLVSASASDGACVRCLCSDFPSNAHENAGKHTLVPGLPDEGGGWRVARPARRARRGRCPPERPHAAPPGVCVQPRGSAPVV